MAVVAQRVTGNDPEELAAWLPTRSPAFTEAPPSSFSVPSTTAKP
ncbi:hypothetical protein ACFQ2B_14475 [Streptomyces stramineus]